MRYVRPHTVSRRVGFEDEAQLLHNELAIEGGVKCAERDNHTQPANKVLHVDVRLCHNAVVADVDAERREQKERRSKVRVTLLYLLHRVDVPPSKKRELRTKDPCKRMLQIVTRK